MSVTEIFPMRRELKDYPTGKAPTYICGYRNFPDEEGTERLVVDLPGNRFPGYRNFPDEEGTESGKLWAEGGHELTVTEIFPMRRELKDDQRPARREPRSRRYRNFPDEEGTERRRAFIAAGNKRSYRNFPDEEGTESLRATGYLIQNLLALQKFSR